MHIFIALLSQIGERAQIVTRPKMNIIIWPNVSTIYNFLQTSSLSINGLIFVMRFVCLY